MLLEAVCGIGGGSSLLLGVGSVRIEKFVLLSLSVGLTFVTGTTTPMTFENSRICNSTAKMVGHQMLANIIISTTD